MEEVVVDVVYLNVIIGVVIPLAVGLVAKLQASSSVKAALNLGLSALAGVLTEVIQTEGAFDLRAAIVAFGLTWATSIASYYGFWKPTSAAQVVQIRTARFGVGPSVDKAA